MSQVPAAGARRGVLFDIDDTLVDMATAFASAISGSIGALTPLSDDDAARVVQVWRDDAGGHYRAFVAGERGFTEQRRLRLAEITDLLGVTELDEHAFAAWDADYLERFAASWRLFDDARACVESAIAAGLAVGVVTNAPEALQRTKLAAVGLADLLTAVTAVDTVGVGKPDGAIFTAGCRAIGTAPGATVYVGDELDVDARGAQAAGLRGVWLDRPGRRRGGPHAVTDAAVDQARAEAVGVVTSLRDLSALWVSAGG